MKRRTFLTSAGAATVAALAGCAVSDTETTTEGGNGDGATPEGTTTGQPTTTMGAPSGTLRVATYSSFTGEDTAGAYLKSAFEEEYDDVTVEFTVPSNGVNQYIQRKKQGAPLDADMYVGLNTGELVRADQELDSSLFATARGDLERASAVKDGLEIDPEGRAIPYDTGYISLVYDEDAIDQPTTFDALLESRYEGDLITQDARRSDPGRAFLLWSIIDQGEDGYLDYWASLVDNGVRVLDDWEPAYNAYLNEETPMVVSYSTDQVYYHGPEVNMARHQVGFLNDQGYANPEAMARFAGAENGRLARLFMEFVLQPQQQAEVAVRNVQFPAVDDATLPESFSKYAYEPPEPVTMTYDELSGNVDGWIEDWAREVAGN